MKTNRNQLKYPIDVPSPIFLEKDLGSSGVQFFMRLHKEYLIDN